MCSVLWSCRDFTLRITRYVKSNLNMTAPEHATHKDLKLFLLLIRYFTLHFNVLRLVVAFKLLYWTSYASTLPYPFTVDKGMVTDLSIRGVATGGNGGSGPPPHFCFGEVF